jgi:uncharacterized protein YkwD
MDRRSAVLAAFVLGACAAATPVAPGVTTPTPVQSAADQERLPPVAAQYTTAARGEGVVGGPRAARLAQEMREVLRARGDEGEPDGALAAVATWIAGQDAEARRRGMREMAARAGFAGEASTAAVFQLDGGDDDLWRRALASVARNLAINRYGVYVSPDGVAVAVFGRVEVSLDPFPRHFRTGQSCRLRGDVAARYERAHVYLTRPDGKVDETQVPGRRIEVALPLSVPGAYRVEVMSDGATGPVVLANVPIYVDVDEPAAPWAALREEARTVAPAEAEARMLTLLNEVRRAAGLAPVAADADLRAVAIGHTQDMIAGRFFGHVSPTTGRVDDRLQRAGVLVRLAGENLAQAETAEQAHRFLMDSPGHRANMLGAKFTHVGIGVGVRSGEAGELLATLVFARRPRLPSEPVTPALVTSALSSLRRAKGAGPVHIDPVLQRAAEAGIAVLGGGDAAQPDGAIAAAHAALVAESKRRHLGRRSVCIAVGQLLELDDLEQDPLLLQPRPLNIGLAPATRQIGQATKIFVLVVAEGATCG